MSALTLSYAGGDTDYTFAIEGDALCVNTISDLRSETTIIEIPAHVRFRLGMMLVESTGCADPCAALLAGMIAERRGAAPAE